MLRVFTLHWSIAKTDVRRQRTSSFQIRLVSQLIFSIWFLTGRNKFNEFDSCMAMIAN